MLNHLRSHPIKHQHVPKDVPIDVGGGRSSRLLIDQTARP